MENTIENVVKLLTKMIENSYLAADHFREIDPAFSLMMRREAMNREICLWLLTKPKYFNDMWESYFINEEED